MRILILGGGWFLGRALVAAGLQAGHDVTVFNRGRSGPDPEGVTVVHGDRESSADLARLVAHGPWDVIVDSSGQVPETVLAGARALARVLGGSGRYIFVSSVSAYEGWPVEPLDESSPILACPPDAEATFGVDDPRGYPTRYGYLKAGCERAVAEAFGQDRALILRPGVILGPWEYVGRLPWWLRRVSSGGRVLAPGRPDKAIQPMDVRDVAEFAVKAAADGRSGAFNVAAPADGTTTFAGFLAAVQRATGGDAVFEWVDEDFLIAAGVRQWTEIPLWRSFPGTWRVATGKAEGAGLRHRPIETTVADTWAWLRGGNSAVASERAAELGIDSGKEAAILRDWDGRGA